jgi:hypothetical protein
MHKIMHVKTVKYFLLRGDFAKSRKSLYWPIGNNFSFLKAS